MLEPFRWIAVIACFGMTVAAAEHLAGMKHFADDGLLSWQVMRTQGGWGMRGISGSVAGFFLGYPMFRLLVLLRLACAAACGALAAFHVWIPWIWLLLLLTTVSLNFRTGFGLDGAYQMNVIVLAGTFAATLFASSSLIQELCLAFIAAEAILSYGVAGYWKLVSPVWRGGGALVGIFGTSIYGHPLVHRHLSVRPRLSRVLCWGTILFECTFPFSILGPPELLIVYLGIGCLFHANTALFMGLNGFFFAFTSTYPAVAHVAGWISTLLWGSFAE